MGTLENRYVVDLGGGIDWLLGQGHGEWVLHDMRNIRAAKLARENPHLNYLVIDHNIPFAEAKIVHDELPNLHFIRSKLEDATGIPLSNESVERVEINHMWTPLTFTPGIRQQSDIERLSDTTNYLRTLKESCRILKSNGVLSLTEKADRLEKIRYFLTWSLISALGLNTNPETQVLAIITDPNRSDYTQLAFLQNVDVYCLELRKR